MSDERLPGDNQRRLRVLHLTAGSEAGGVSRYLYDLCGTMTRRGHEVMIAGGRGSWHDLFASAPWPWLDLPMGGGPFDLWRASRSLLRVIEREPVDILHAHYRKATLVARRLARQRNIPVLVTLHLTDIPMRWPWGALTDWGDHVHTPSEHGHRWLREQGVAETKISVIPHGVDPRSFPVATAAERMAARAALGLPEGATVAAFVGRFDEPKNETWLLDVAARLADLRLVMLGGGPREAELRRQITHRSLDDRVTLVDYGDPLPVYRAADAVLLPSAREGFSLVNTEAMCVGRPVLRTRTAGTEEQIVEGVTGRSTPIDRAAFVDAAVAFLSDRPALEKMGVAAAAHVRARLTHDQQVDRTLDLYRGLIDRRPRPIFPENQGPANRSG